MTLSSQTKDHIFDAATNVRAALRSAVVDETSVVIAQLSRILFELESIEPNETIFDILSKQKS